MPLQVASSSRSQLAMQTAGAVAWLTWEATSVGVLWRPLVATAVVTHIVTRLRFAGHAGRARPCDLPRLTLDVVPAAAQDRDNQRGGRNAHIDL